jgi:hypothetical protein
MCKTCGSSQERIGYCVMCGRELCHACVNPINLRVHLAHSSEKRSASNRAEVGVSPYLDHRGARSVEEPKYVPRSPL